MYGTLAAVCLAALFLGSANADTRIVNGQPIEITHAPYIVQLRKYNQPFCGGTLVDLQYVVTAAHCFDDHHPSTVEVVAGVNTRTEDGVRREIIHFVKPSLYTKETTNADVAILKLDSPMPMGDPRIKPIAICSSAVPANQMLTVSGWGRQWTNGPPSHHLLTVDVQVMDLNECVASVRWRSPITNLMMCTRPSPMDSCAGDSGGPGIYNSELCGIVSFGGVCGGSTPGMYTDVYALSRFIIGNIENMKKRN